MLFDQYLEESESMIILLKRRLDRRTPGHKMTDMEAWQYVSWGQFKVLDQLSGANPTVNKALHQLQHVMAQECATQYIGRHTGTFPPPIGQTGFKHPDELEKLKAKWDAGMNVSDETAPSDEGWTPKGYL